MEEGSTSNSIIEITKSEDQGFFQDIMLDRTKIRNKSFNLKDKHNFEKSIISDLVNKLSRKNIIYYGIMTGEEAIKSEDTSGTVKLSIINQEQILSRLEKIKEKNKIQYIHISTIQFIIKSTFIDNIESPMILELTDNRFTDEKNGLIAYGQGNLKYGKIKFDVNLQIGIHLGDKDLDRSILLKYELLKKNLYKKGNSPFTITYQINYALTNSHHSIEFKSKEKIYINDLFKPLIELKTTNKIQRTGSMRLIKNTEDKIEEDKGKKKLEIIEDKSLTELQKLYKEVSALNQKI